MRAQLFAALVLLAAVPTRAADVNRPVTAEFFGMHMNMGTYRENFGWPGVPFGTWRLIHTTTVWSGLEPEPGKWQWAALDKAVADAAARGVEPLLTLGHPPLWAARVKSGAPLPKPGAGHPGFPPADLKVWQHYVTTVAQRYKGRVRWFELWNEPHFTETDRPDVGFSVNDMVAVARTAQEALRAVDAQNRLVSFSPPGAERGIQRLALFFERGGGRYIDAIGFHFYTTPPLPETIAVLAGKLRQAADRNGLANLPIWNTEAGYLTEDPEYRIAAGPINRQGDRYLTAAEAAAFVPRTHLMALHAGLQRYYYYGWGIKTYTLSGLLGRGYSAVGLAYQTSHRWLFGNIFQGCRNTNGTLWQCTLSRPSDGARVEIAWSTAATGEQITTPHRWVEAIGGVTTAVPGRRSVRVTGTPVLFKQQAAVWSADP